MRSVRAPGRRLSKAGTPAGRLDEIRGKIRPQSNRRRRTSVSRERGARSRNLAPPKWHDDTVIQGSLSSRGASSKAAQWNWLELLRDPSHVRCLPLTELTALFGKVGLEQPAESLYGVQDSVKNLLGRSFPNPGDDAKITAMFAASVKDDSLGIPATFEAGEFRYTYPTAILSAVRH